jgi:hypothetical protein
MIIPPNQPPDRTITISQTSHSWISGQLARAWGNDLFSRFEPFEQMCYAAEQHDIGFLDWESRPTLDIKTGLPYTFDELPESLHFEIWHQGISQLVPVCYYASLVVSLHFSSLCERFHQRQSGTVQPEVENFLESQREHQNKARKELQRDPFLERAVVSEVLEYHCGLIAVWDFLSLELCRGRSAEFKIPHVPISDARQVDLFLRQKDKTESIWEVDPWPFAVQTLTALCEGRMLNQRFTETEKMRRALSDSHRVTVLFNLAPAG